jgi:pyrophosphatase PpaX
MNVVMNPKKAVLFDLDGTVANTIPLIVASYRHAVREVLGRTPGPVESRAWIGRTLVATFDELAPDRSAELVERYTRFNLEHLPRLIERYPGIGELLGELARASVKLALRT